MKRVVCFYIPEPLARWYKTHNEFHKYRMKWKFISDSFYHMLKSQKRKKNTVLSSFIADFTAENAPTSGRYLWRHRRTATSQKCVPALCHKYRIWNEFSFHTVFMKRVVFYIPEPLARGYKTHYEFHKYRMKWKFISDSFYHMIIPKNINTSWKK